MKYDWKKYTARSDERYKAARDNNNVEDLERHNILKGGEVELRFVRDLAKAYFNTGLNTHKALDVACGIGYVSKCLADLGYEVVGFDLNPDAIAIAKSRHPTVDFFVSDASDLVDTVSQHQYDLIMAREVHCFSRIADDMYHQNLVETYLALLNPGGVLVIAHSRTGVDTQYPSIDFKSLSNALDPHRYLVTGPHFMFLYKHLRLFIPLRIVISIQSQLTKLIALLSGKRWIEFFVILKK